MLIPLAITGLLLTRQTILKSASRCRRCQLPCAGVGQRNHSGLVFDQRPHPVVDSIEKPADQPGIEVLLEPEIEQRVERIPAGLARDVGYRAIAEPMLGLHRRATMTRSQLPWNTVPGLGLRRSARNAFRPIAR